MRLFIALALPSDSADELDRLLTPLRPAWPGLRWTGRDAWHLTLAFLGEVDEGHLGNLTGRLGGASAHHSPLSLWLAGAGAFPARGRARVLWTGVKGDRRGLARLARSVAGVARKAGVPLAEEERRYRPHLTLARCRAPVDVRPLVEELAGFHGTPWVANEFHLIRSRLGAQPRYETLGTWRLRERSRKRRAREAGKADDSPSPGPGEGPPKGLARSA